MCAQANIRLIGFNREVGSKKKKKKKKTTTTGFKSKALRGTELVMVGLVGPLERLHLCTRVLGAKTNEKSVQKRGKW